MAERRTIGNIVAPWRFLAFLAVFIVAVPLADSRLHNLALSLMAGFDAAALLFLIICAPLIHSRDSDLVREHAKQNDANRGVLLAITGIVMAVLLVAIAAEAVGRNPEPFTKVLIILTLVLAWLFSNTVYALHYAHLAYRRPDAGCLGFEFPGTREPIYWDFIYFSFACGMAFATSDVNITSSDIRKIVTFHCLAAFGFNIGVLAFTINLLASGG